MIDKNLGEKILEELNSYKKSIKEMKLYLEEIDIKYKKLKDEYLGLKSIVKVSNLSAKVDEINHNEKIIEDLNREYSEIIAIKEKSDLEIKALDDKIHKIELELIKARELYSEKCRFRDEKYITGN